MQYQPSLFARDDTFFGVCAALGQDFGFHPNFLRVAFAVALYFNPVLTISAYAAAGLIVGFSRLVVREPRIPIVEAQPEEGAAAQAQAEEPSAVAEEEAEALPIAA